MPKWIVRIGPLGLFYWFQPHTIAAHTIVASPGNIVGGNDLEGLELIFILSISPGRPESQSSIKPHHALSNI